MKSATLLFFTIATIANMAEAAPRRRVGESTTVPTALHPKTRPPALGFGWGSYGFDYGQFDHYDDGLPDLKRPDGSYDPYPYGYGHTLPKTPTPTPTYAGVPTQAQEGRGSTDYPPLQIATLVPSYGGTSSSGPTEQPTSSSAHGASSSKASEQPTASSTYGVPSTEAPESTETPIGPKCKEGERSTCASEPGWGSACILW